MSDLRISVEIANQDVKTLEEICLEVIIKEFSTFATAFELNEDENLKMNFRFLRKIYSKRLLQRLCSEKRLKEYHLNFLLNEYVKDLRIDDLLDYTSKDYLLEKLIPIGKSIRHLSCTARKLQRTCLVTRERWEKMKKQRLACSFLKEFIPHVAVVLEINVSVICNDTLLHLIATSCSQLNVLNISSSRVSGDGLKALYTNSEGFTQAKCPLKQIDISDIEEIDDKDVAALLENVPTLEKVTYEILTDVLSNLSQDVRNKDVPKRKLNLIYLESPSYGGYPKLLLANNIKACAEICPNISDLCVRIHLPQEIESCSFFPNLERVRFITNDVIAINLNGFLEMRGQNLKHIYALLFKLSISTLIENCPNLKTLHLELNRFDAINTKIVRKLIHLKHLVLWLISPVDDNCVDSLMLLLNSSPNLEYLKFTSSELIDSNMITKLTAYSLICKLKQLEINDSRVNFILVEQFLLNCSSLQSLKLKNCTNLTTENILSLKHIANVLHKKAS